MIELRFGTNLYNKKIINAPLLNKSLLSNSTVLDIIKSAIMKRISIIYFDDKIKASITVLEKTNDEGV